MQYSVPQFVEVEDKIIGPLTLKQFLILLGGGLIELLLYSIFKGAVAILIFLSLPNVVFFGYLAFGKLNGRPIMSSLPSVARFSKSPKIWVFDRTGEKTISLSRKKTPIEEKLTLANPQAVGSQLKRLAYLLDQKTAEEDRIIHSGGIEKKWLNQT